MLFRYLCSNDRGLTLIEILIGLVFISIIALALQQFITHSFRTNDHIIEDTDTLVTANKIFNSITEALKCGFDFVSSDEGRTLNFTTDNFDAADQEITTTVSWDGRFIRLTRDGDLSQVLNSDRDRIENLIFNTPNQFNVLITLTIDGKDYETTIRGMNQFNN
jgi:prepilin-type N-terminal cleavage/methylation domain-containing protein